MARAHPVTVTLSSEEHEWVRRRAHWEGRSMSSIFREHVRHLIAEEGYLRPPDDEPQDFGYEKELMQFVISVQSKAGDRI